MAVADTDLPASSSGLSDWLLELVIGVVVVVLGGSVWAYTHFSGQPDAQQTRPKPTWLAMPKIMAQMADGRMVNVKVNLQLGKDKDADELGPHIPAFTALIEETGTHISEDDLHGLDGLKRFSHDMKVSLNGYLKAQGVETRVKDVAFDELMLMP